MIVRLVGYNDTLIYLDQLVSLHRQNAVITIRYRSGAEETYKYRDHGQARDAYESILSVIERGLAGITTFHLKEFS